MGGGEVRFLDTTTPGEQVRQEAADQGGRLREVRENQTADQGIDGPVAREFGGVLDSELVREPRSARRFAPRRWPRRLSDWAGVRCGHDPIVRVSRLVVVGLNPFGHDRG